MTPPLTEGHLRTALHAQADGVEPDADASLAAVRRRGRSAIVRRRAVLGGAVATLVVVAGVLVLPRLGDENSTVIVEPGPSTTTTPEPSTTTEPQPIPPAPTPPVDEVPFVWPPAGGAQFTDPLAAARAFVTDYVGLSDPPLGDVIEEEPRRVQVPVFARGEDGSVLGNLTRSTIHLFQGGDDNWRVTLASSEAIVVDSLEAAQSAAAIFVGGRGRGFEGTVIVEARAAASAPGDFLDQEVTIAGSGEELAPFEVTLALPRPPDPTDSVLLYNDSGFEGAVPDFTVVPVATTPTETPVDVYFVGPEGTVQPVTRPVTPPAVLNGALELLFDGPNPEERARGLTTAFPENAGQFPPTAAITNGVATVDIPIGLAQPDPAQPGQTLPPAQAEQLVEQLGRTVFQFPNISQVQFTMSGSCEDFGRWTGRPGTCLYDRALLDSGG